MVGVCTGKSSVRYRRVSLFGRNVLEEAGWLASRTGRQALGLALTGMLRDGEITRARAIELAKMVLRDNARKLYGLP